MVYCYFFRFECFVGIVKVKIGGEIVKEVKVEVFLLEVCLKLCINNWNI